MPIQPRFTNAGKELHLRALGGEELLFTKIQIGCGELGATSYKTFNSLLEPKVTVPISSIKIDGDCAAIRGYFDNRKVTEGFYYREIGLFAKDPDDPSKEILYAYGNVGSDATYIAEPSSRLIEFSIKILAVIDDAENVKAVINGSAVYVDFSDLESAMNEHNSDLNAHPSMLNQRLTLYVDCDTTEELELRKGTMAHPYKTLMEAAYSCPTYVRALDIKLMRIGEYSSDAEIYLGGADSSLESLTISYVNSSAKPLLCDTIVLQGLNDVTIRNVDFLADDNYISTYYSKLMLSECKNVQISNVSVQGGSTNIHGFVECDATCLYMRNVTAINIASAATVRNNSVLHVIGSNFNTTGTPFDFSESKAYFYDVEDIAVDYDDKSLIFTQGIIKKITDGTLLNHLTDYDNPHRVTLEQAMQGGGVIDVPHGGTGQETFSEGSLLKGNGRGAVGMISGAGALFAKTAGSPEFGTLPVTMGGLGRTEIPYGALLVGGSKNVDIVEPKVGALYSINTIQPPKYGILPGQYGGTGFSSLARHSLLVGTGNSDVYEELPLGRGALFNSSNTLQYGTLPVYYGGTGTNGLQSSIMAEEVDGARHGHIVIGFGSGPKILICWGRVRTDLNESVIVAFESRCGNYYKDAHYTLVFGGDDIQNGKVTKENTRFTIEAGASRAADWIAIGEVHE